MSRQTSASESVSRTIWTASLEANISQGWFDERSKFALFRYMAAGDNVIKAGMKRREAEAFLELQLWLAGTLPGLRSWIGEQGCRYLVPMPGHKPADREPTANEEMCRLIAQKLPGLTILPRALVRTEEVSSFWRTGIHPGQAGHIRTLEWRGRRLPRDGGVLTFDDQYTSGETFAAASFVLAVSARVRPIGLFLTRSRALGPPNPIIKRATRL